MANTKISALTALTGANLATDDVFAVVDTSAAATKSITVAELKLGIMPAPGPIGATTPSTGAFTTVSATGNSTVGTTTVYNAAGFARTFGVYDAGSANISIANASAQYQLGVTGPNLNTYLGGSVVTTTSSTGLAVTGTISATTGAAVGGATAGAGGLAFPATAVAVADANTLDDYEEGSWTPTVYFGGASVGATYTTQTGRYTKTGNRVCFTAFVTLSSKGSSTGSMAMTGLPFTASASSGTIALSVRFQTLAAGVACVAATLPVPSTTVFLEKFAAGATSFLTDADANNTSSFYVSGHYEV